MSGVALVLTDIQHSTRYDDKELIDKDDISKLDFLTENLNIEITLSSSCPLKLERLAERYYCDAAAASKAQDMGYYMRYMAAYRRILIIENSFYDIMRPVV